jgi:putative tryptophan/tyrosine transport system substrate-binding protein
MRLVRLTALAVTALALSGTLLVRSAEAAGQVPRIGYLGNWTTVGGQEEAFRQGLRDLGWIEGQTVVIEYGWADGHLERLPKLATELVQLRSDVIVVSGALGIEAAKRATSKIPIVVAAVLNDPVRSGYVSSLAHPGGNITGLASQYESIITKQVELLTESVPGLARLTLLRYAPGASVTTLTGAATSAAGALGLRVAALDVKDPADLEPAFHTARNDRAQGVLVLPSPFFATHRRLLVQLAASSHLPAMYEFREFVQDGGLMSYGVNLPDMFRRAATYVDRILKGTKAGELPIERPTRFEFVINLRTAKTPGLAIPPSVLARADEVIQ